MIEDAKFALHCRFLGRSLSSDDKKRAIAQGIKQLQADLEKAQEAYEEAKYELDALNYFCESIDAQPYEASKILQALEI